MSLALLGGMSEFLGPSFHVVELGNLMGVEVDVWQ